MSHRNHWAWNRTVIAVVVLMMGAICVFCAIYFAEIDRVIPGFILILSFLVLFCCVFIYIYSCRKIYCTNINRNTIFLSGVNAEFAHELKINQDRFEEEFHKWQKRKDEESNSDE